MNPLVSFVVAVMLVLNAASAASAADNMPLKVGIDSEYPPFSFKKDGRYTGFDLELAEALCVSMERPCVFVPMPFDAMLAAMRDGELDLMLGVSSTKERAQYMDFSEPYFRARSMYMGKADGASALGGENGKKRIGVRAGTVQMQHIMAQWGDRALVVVDTYAAILDKLCAGELDFVLTNDLAGYEFLKSARGEAFDVWGDPLPLEAFPSVVRIGVRKGAEALRESVGRAITDIRFNGEYGRINRKYFPYSLY